MTNLETTPSVANEDKKRAHNVIAQDFALALSPALAQAGYIHPNTPLTIEPLFHLRSDPTARPFDISFSPDPTSSHVCPYTTIGGRHKHHWLTTPAQIHEH